jgi:hypothetical protein
MNLPRESTLVLTVLAIASACASGSGEVYGSADPPAASAMPAATALPEPGEEPYLASLRQLTFEGQNAEAYFSPDDQRLVFQATTDSMACDQIFTMRIDGSDKRMISTGAGVTTCAYYVYPDAAGIVFSSTHLADPGCPPRPDYSRGYVWPIHAGYDVFRVGAERNQLTHAPTARRVRRDGSRSSSASPGRRPQNPDGPRRRRRAPLTREEEFGGGASSAPTARNRLPRPPSHGRGGLADYRLPRDAVRRADGDRS